MFIGTKTRVFNRNLDNAIKEKGLTNYYLADVLKTNPGKVSNIRNCKYYPKLEWQLKLAKELDTTIEDIFPESAEKIYEKLSTNYKQHGFERTIEVTPQMIESRKSLYIEPPQIEKTDKSLLSNKIKEILNTLKPKEKEILTLRYGLDGGGKKTLSEVASIFDVTRERIRQMEAKAHEKIRIHSKVSELEEFLIK
jgi:RNA polymerase sigma factor (sigma-70 family)